MQYSKLTYLSLDSAKKARKRLKDAEKKLYWLNENSESKNSDKKYYQHIQIPVSKFLSSFANFNFIGLRKTEKLIYFTQHFN